jgi:hypothetical protein
VLLRLHYHEFSEINATSVYCVTEGPYGRWSKWAILRTEELRNLHRWPSPEDGNSMFLRNVGIQKNLTLIPTAVRTSYLTNMRLLFCSFIPVFIYLFIDLFQHFFRCSFLFFFFPSFALLHLFFPSFLFLRFPFFQSSLLSLLLCFCLISFFPFNLLPSFKYQGTCRSPQDLSEVTEKHCRDVTSRSVEPMKMQITSRNVNRYQDAAVGMTPYRNYRDRVVRKGLAECVISLCTRGKWTALLCALCSDGHTWLGLALSLEAVCDLAFRRGTATKWLVVRAYHTGRRSKYETQPWFSSVSDRMLRCSCWIELLLRFPEVLCSNPDWGFHGFPQLLPIIISFHIILSSLFIAVGHFVQMSVNLRSWHNVKKTDTTATVITQIWGYGRKCDVESRRYEKNQRQINIGTPCIRFEAFTATECTVTKSWWIGIMEPSLAQ